MGRYYTGDIEGKFWFGIQPSNSAKRFGGQESEPQYIEYYFNTDDLDDIKKEIEKIENSLGSNLQKIKDFFITRSGYTEEQLSENGITNAMLSDYADLKLGIQIRDCVIAEGSCRFDAEL